MINQRLTRILSPVLFSSGLGALAGLLIGTLAALLDGDFAKGLQWLALRRVVSSAESGLALGALCGLVGFLLARRGRDERRGAWAWMSAGLLGILAIGVLQRALWPVDGESLFVTGLVYLAPPVLVIMVMAGVGMGWRLAREGRRLWILAGAALLLPLVGLEAVQAFREVTSGDRPNILLVVVDCLRADRLGTRGRSQSATPGLDQLAEKALVFENAHSTAAWTKPAITSLLTGLYPATHGAVDPFDVLPRSHATLPEILANKGYQTVFLNGGNTFVSSEFGFAEIFDDYEFLYPHFAPDVLDAFRRRLPELATRPFFVYLHLMDVHLPYSRNNLNENDSRLATARDELLPGQIKAKTLRALHERGELSQADRDLVEALYDYQVRFVDGEITRLLSFIARSGLADSTTVIVTSDHGEELWEHSSFEHGHTLYREVTHVPLLIAGNGLRAGRVSDLVSLVDLLPTIAALAGVERRGGLDGSELLRKRHRPGPPEREGIFLSGTFYGAEKFAFLSRDGRAIINTRLFGAKLPLVGSRSFAEREWYVESDPSESDNRAPEAPQAVWEAIVDYRRRTADPVEKVDPSATAREQLKALGYLQ